MGAGNSDGLTYLVQTSLGNTLLSSGSKALVNLVGETYLPVSVDHLKEGQMILYLKEHIDKTLEEVEPVLQKSARYVTARDAMHATDGKGNRITRLRRDLITSFGKEAGVENLEARLYGAKGDFDEGEYGKMIDRVEAVLKDAGVEHQYHRTTLKSWLDGSTLAPLDWAVFDALAKQSLVFAEYSAPEKQLKEHYSLYVTVRKGIMHYLASKGKEPPKSHQPEKERKRKGGSLKLEIDLVVEEFMEDISAQYALAQVTSIKPLTPRELARPLRPDVRLHDGVITGKVEDEHVRLVSYSEITTHRNMLEGTMLFVFENYFQRTPDNILLAGFRAAGLPAEKVGSYEQAAINTPLLRRHFKTAPSSDRNMINLLEQRLGKKVNLQAFASETAERMQDGTIDAVVGLEEGTVMRAYRTLSRLSVAVPDLANELDNVVPFRVADKVAKQRVESRMKEMERRLLEEYGFDVTKTKTMFTLAVAIMTPDQVRLDKSKYYRDVEMMDAAARMIAEKEQLHKVLTKAEGQAILESYGFGQLMTFIPETVWSADAWRKSQ